MAQPLLSHYFMQFLSFRSILRIFAAIALVSCAETCLATYFDLSQDIAIANAVDQMCDRSIALLGEASHGDGVTFEIKTRIVQQLVEKCHYNTFVIESGIYDGLEIRRRQLSNEILTQTDILNSISGLWSKTKEVSPLLNFLTLKLNSSKDFYFGGMDDQLTSTYAAGKMASDLTQGVCLADLSKFTSLKYYQDRTLFNADNEKKLVACLDQIEKQIPKFRHSDKSAMITNLRSLIYRNFHLQSKSGDEALNQRDRTMYQNFLWISSQRPKGSKIIIWAASSHNAKSMKDYRGDYRNFGGYVHNRYGQQAFSLAFTAFSGNAGSKLSPTEVIPDAPANSLEGRVNDGVSSYIFVSPQQLAELGKISARPLGYVFSEQIWSSLFDGILWIRTEHPPTY